MLDKYLIFSSKISYFPLIIKESYINYKIKTSFYFIIPQILSSKKYQRKQLIFLKYKLFLYYEMIKIPGIMQLRQLRFIIV